MFRYIYIKYIKALKNNAYPIESIHELESYRIGKFVQNVCKELYSILDFHRNNLRNPVTVFTSARNKEGSDEYAFNMKLGHVLAKHGFQVLTGGGPGGMEAVNRGAKEAGGNSFGIDIQVPFENEPNQYLDANLMCKYFFTRKLGLLLPAVALIVTPGGFGTHDELFEVIHLKDRNNKLSMPIILVGKEYYQPLYNRLLVAKQKGHIKRPVEELIQLIDNPEEIAKYIDKYQQPLSSFRLIDIDHIYETLSIEMIKLTKARRYHPFTVSIFASSYENQSWWWPYESVRKLANYLTLNRISVLARASDPFIGSIFEGYEEAKNKYSDNRFHYAKPICLECLEENSSPITNSISLRSSLVFENKLLATKFSNLGSIFYPGGAGTLDYFFELLCLKQTFKINVPVPIPAFQDIEKALLIPFGTIHDVLNDLEIIDDDGHITSNFQPRNPRIDLSLQKDIPLEAEEAIANALIKSQNIPIILMGTKFWQPYLKYFKDSLIKSYSANIEDLGLFTVTNNYIVALTDLFQYRRSLIP